MTELEMIERAKRYMDQLANGVDPISGEPVPDTDTINNVRLSRCFFFVSDVLRRVLENGGVTPPKKQSKRPFSLPAGRLEQFRFSETPLTVTEIAKRISELAEDDTMQPMRYTVLTDWLIGLGLLTIETGADGRNAKRPTPEGVQMGITTEERTGSQGTYLVVLYDRGAQQFIVDNLEAALQKS